MTLEDLDKQLMRGAIVLARRGLGRTAPNPAVGAVVFQPDRDDPGRGEIVGRGWTQPGGRPHAEPVALDMAGGRARGATLYVTLEPCAHHGGTPPCVDAIIAAGIRRVVYGITDPDPRVGGRGLDRLDAAGIDVATQVLGAEARAVTLGHVQRVGERRPFVQLKIAVDGNGCVAAGRNGVPTWVTGRAARARGHLLRAQADAILIGSGTAVADNPSLDCRLPGLAAQSPRVVVLSAAGRLEAGRKLFCLGGRGNSLVIVGRQNVFRQANALRYVGAEVVGVAEVDGRLWIPAVLEALVERGVTRLLVEGGPAVWQAFDRAGMIDEVVMFRGGLGEVRFDEEAANRMRARHVTLTQMKLGQRMRVGEDDLVSWQRV